MVPMPTFLFTDRMKSTAVKAGGGGVPTGAIAVVAVVECPPCGEGNCEVEATSPTATHVEQERDV